MRPERLTTGLILGLACPLPIGPCLDLHLEAGHSAPVAIAFSGGGDSLALLLSAAAWAKCHGRRVLALTVDHRLRPESAAWSRFCRERAANLGVEHRVLAWEGPKPATGVAAVARAMRHRLLAGAAREAGAAVILMGHTADDLGEAAVMRQTGSTTPSPRIWSPSPVWPEGRDIFLLRPLLGLRRAALRAALVALGETWIDDPGNVDPGSARARARALIAGGPLAEGPAGVGPVGTVEDVGFGPAGDLCLPVGRLTGASDGLALLGAALLTAAGAERPPRRAPLTRLMARLADGPFTATLAGARLESDGSRTHLVRDVGDTRRGAIAEVALPKGLPIVWDGRFEVFSSETGWWVGALTGRTARLPAGLRAALGRISPAARRALPVLAYADGTLTLPTVRPNPAAAVRVLGPSRLAAARGAIIDEATLRRMAKGDHPY